MLTSEEIEKLLSQQSISEVHPWNTNDVQVIDNFYRRVCAAISLGTKAQSRIEWNHYGSGYASYIDAWFYKTDSDFNLSKLSNYEQG